MHILILPSSFPSELNPVRACYVEDQAKALARAGVRVGVIYPEQESMRAMCAKAVRTNYFQFEEYHRDGVVIFQCCGWSFPKLKRLNLSIYRLMARFLFRKYVAQYGIPDLIHAHGFLPAGYIALDISKYFGLPYVVTEHSSAFARQMYGDWHREKIINTSKHARQCIAVSRFLADQIQSFGVDEKVEVVPNVVDTKYFSLKSRLDNKDKFTFLTVSLLNDNKTVDLLIHAFCNAFKGQSKYQLVIGGDGPSKASLESMVDSLGVREQVQFLGSLTRDAVRESMWQANCFVLTSKKETFGVVLIEAMSTGLPVISTRSGGPDEVVPTHLGGALVNVDSLDELQQQMLFCSQANSLNVVRRQIREYVIQRYGETALQTKLMQMYERMIK